MSASHSIKKEDHQFICADSYPITGTVYTPESPKAAVMICPATGIKRRFYDSFATYLCNAGYAVITFDNRGIGESLTGDLKECSATIRDWGYLDMPCILDNLMSLFPNTSYHVIGHSAGGQLVGLMHNWKHIHSMFNFACSSGQLKNMSTKDRLLGLFFLNIFAPISNSVFGFTHAEWLGMGEPLPKGVAKEWKTWCNGQGYVETDFGKNITQHWYSDIDFPSYWLNATDDYIANDANVDDMTRVFSQLKPRRLTLKPEDFDFNDIGHMKFFSRQCESLWPLATDWLEEHCPKP